MKRIAAVAYGLLAYLAFLLPIGYLLLFLADVGVSKTVNRGAGPLGPALAVDVALLLLFGIQHSVMARPGFKDRIRAWVPPSLERSTYVLVSGLVLSLLFVFWRPIPAVLWDVRGTGLEGMAWAGFSVGWAVAVWATFALSHLHLFGLSQVVARVRGVEHPRLGLRTPLLYRIVRHPMSAGLMLAFWSTPRMTVGHLVFAAGMTAYTLGATILEERDLLHSFPEAYRKYRRKVPALVPVLRPGFLAPRRGGLGFELSMIVGVLGLLAALVLNGIVRASSSAAAETLGEEGPTAFTRVGATPDLSSPVSGLQLRTLVSGGVARSYRVYSAGESHPTGASDRRRPLVLALHGTGGDGDRLRGFLGGELERVAGEEGWLVVYPEAWKGAWNDCRRTAGAAARKAGIDDVSFLRDLITHLGEVHDADPGRVFLLGYSGGGHMAFRIALEAPDLARAVAVFGASLPRDEETTCFERTDSPIPSIMIVNGTRDPINPFDGGDVIAPTGAFLGAVRSSPETAEHLRRRARAPTDVILVEIQGGGHVVPGPASRFPVAVGPTVPTYRGVREAVAFFARKGSPVFESASESPPHVHEP